MVTDAKENYRKSRRILSKKDSSGISIRCPKKSSQVVLVVKNPSANAGDVRDTGSIPGLGRFPGEGNSNPPQYSCLENPMDEGAWWATVHGVAKSRTRLSYFPFFLSFFPVFLPGESHGQRNLVGYSP